MLCNSTGERWIRRKHHDNACQIKRSGQGPVGVTAIYPLPSPEEIMDVVKAKIVANEKLARQVSMHICHKYSGARLREIGSMFGVREAAIAESSRQLLLKMKEDKKLREIVDQLRKKLNV